MNITAKSKSSRQRLPVQWLDAPAVGPVLIQFPGSTRALACSGRRPRRPHLNWIELRTPLRSLRAFTLLELMVVIAIIGFIAALALPRVAGFGKANSMITATRQLLDDVALARQRAMVNRSTVYMVFLPPQFWNDPYYSGNMSGQQVTNLMEHQYTAYALISLATVGDQPGQHHPQYVTDWRVLPNGVFIAPWQFTLTNNNGNITVSNIVTTNTLNGTTNWGSIFPWTWVNVPFPSLYSTNFNGTGTYMYLPAIGFTPQGSMTTPPDRRQYEYIALARGSIFYPTDTNGVPLFEPPLLSEVPPNNDIYNPNLIQIDLLTARGTLMQNQFQ
jgi:prepilin-type N-terminal cleavage/methylation domain-containing protein